MIVLDASAALELLFATQLGKVVAERIRAPEVSLHAPHLIDLEIAQAARRYVSLRTVTAARARRALDDFLLVDLHRYPHDALLPRIWALRENLTAYDAAYVALAEVLQCPLLTCDQRLGSAPGAVTPIEVVSA